MLVAVVGGNLQGVEAAYLARKAGWHVRVVDKNLQAPASGLCDSFVQHDVTEEKGLPQALRDVDLVIPALEDDDALTVLTRWSRQAKVPLVFDPAAYAISSSKLESNRLFARMGLPLPGSWPKCGLPVLAKPSRGSGSMGVQVFRKIDSLQHRFPAALPQPGWILQEYIEGSLHSLEVIGVPGNYRALQVTDLYMDESYDCKRVVAPSELSSERSAEFKKLSLDIAEALKLHGIMDVEVVLDQKGFKILEIDARLPSQTPITVYWSTGHNMVQALGDLFTGNFTETQASTQPVRGTVYEHIRVSPEALETKGEHIMTRSGPLYLRPDFFGAHEAITNYDSARKSWVATLIITGRDRSSALARSDGIIKEIAGHFSIKRT
ncbi:MAG: 3-methylornithine--L-lysine ligase PylC [Desulfobacterales bacterium]|nr:MAG: 3-methylornithine--L-lysine ligase PylC [Desulfobacterales bacterium]